MLDFKNIIDMYSKSDTEVTDLVKGLYIEGTLIRNETKLYIFLNNKVYEFETVN